MRSLATVCYRFDLGLFDVCEIGRKAELRCTSEQRGAKAQKRTS